MNQELKSILITYKELDFYEKIKDLREKLAEAARFQGYDGDDRKTVLAIIRKVGDKKTGTKDLLEYTKTYDADISFDELEISQVELKNTHDTVKESNPSLLSSIQKSIQNVRKYQSDIFIGNKISHPGIRYTPLESVGICVPGASAPLPSTVIMTAVSCSSGKSGENCYCIAASI